MDPLPVDLDLIPESRRPTSRRVSAIIRPLNVEDATERHADDRGGSLSPHITAIAPADEVNMFAADGLSPPPAFIESVLVTTKHTSVSRTLADFIPRCGGQRALEDEHRVIPRAPIGVPHGVAHSVNALTPQQLLQRQTRVRLENSRVRKWLDMLATTIDSPRIQKRLKKRCRKGIPDTIRGLAWFRLLRCAEMRDAAPAGRSYGDLLRIQLPLGFVESADAAPAVVPPVKGQLGVGSTSTSAPESGASGTAPSDAHPLLVIPESAADVVGVLERDINRTFPSQGLFTEVGGVGQVALFRILVANLYLDPEVGYCQGMGFLAAMLLCYMPEEDAFWAFRALMRGPHLPHQVWRMFVSGLPRVPVVAHVLQGLINRALPRVSAHLLRFGVHPTMYSTQWYMTAFTYTLPFDAAVRVWDAFLCEGWKAMHRTSLAVLKLLEPQLLACRDFEQTVIAFRRLGEPDFVDPDALGVVSGATKLRQKDIDALEAEYALLEAAGLPTADAFAGSWPRDAAAARALHERRTAAARK